MTEICECCGLDLNEIKAGTEHHHDTRSKPRPFAPTPPPDPAEGGRKTKPSADGGDGPPSSTSSAGVDATHIERESGVERIVAMIMVMLDNDRFKLLQASFAVQGPTQK